MCVPNAHAIFLSNETIDLENRHINGAPIQCLRFSNDKQNASYYRIQSDFNSTIENILNIDFMCYAPYSSLIQKNQKLSG